MESQACLTESLPMVEQPALIISIENNIDVPKATTSTEVPFRQQESGCIHKACIHHVNKNKRMAFVNEHGETTNRRMQRPTCSFIQQSLTDIEREKTNRKYLRWSMIIVSVIFSPLLISLITAMIYFSRFNRTASICFGLLSLATLTAMTCLCRKNNSLGQHLLCKETKFSNIHEERRFHSK